MTPRKAAAPKADAKSLESSVMDALRSANFDNSRLDSLVRLIAGLSSSGLRPGKVFPRGIPVPDGAWIHTVVDRGGITALVDALATHERIDEIRIFPKGIPVPEVFLAEVGIR